MKMKLRLLRLILITFFCSQNLIAQLSIQFPSERAVFQRDLNNEGTIHISGSIDKPVDKIEAKLEEYKSGVLNAFSDWQEIDNNSNFGGFSGQLKVKGGWYRLHVRSLIDGKEYKSSILNKVGVGEVFVISGQSNAQGLAKSGGVGATDDRVNCANFKNNNESREPNLDLAFSQLSNNVNIGPTGNSAWVWGQIGDSLAKKLNVPIMFFNTALTGTLSGNWYQSSIGNSSLSAITYTNYTAGFPYQYLKTSLNFYASIFGIRAVLWHQGETDTYPGIPREQEIFDYYKAVIEKSRADFGQNIAWMFSKTSFSSGLTSNNVLNAQQRIIDEPNFNTFEGPYTDTLMIPRFDEVHFGNTANVNGLDLLAKAWIEKLNTSFFDACQPIQTNPLVDLNLTCSQNNSASITSPTGFTLFKWNDGSNASTKLASSGKISAFASNSIGNYKVGKEHNLNAISFSAPPVLADKPFICPKESLVLSAQKGLSSVKWASGENQASITITQGGTYSFTAKNSLGCQLNSSLLEVSQVALPEIAKEMTITVNSGLINANKTYEFCEGSGIDLKVKAGFSSYVWSDNSNEVLRKVSDTGEYSYRGVYGQGCITDSSPIISAIKHIIPLRPEIVQSGIYELSISDTAKHDFYYWKIDGQDISQNTPTLKIDKSGFYQVKVKDSNGPNAQCESDISNGFNAELINSAVTIAYPNPAKDAIYIESPFLQKNVKVSLIDGSGRLVKEIPNIASWINKLTIPVNDVPPGVYNVILESAETILRKKISIL
jgi:hypothetical protein